MACPRTQISQPEIHLRLRSPPPTALRSPRRVRAPRPDRTLDEIPKPTGNRGIIPPPASLPSSTPRLASLSLRFSLLPLFIYFSFPLPPVFPSGCGGSLSLPFPSIHLSPVPPSNNDEDGGDDTHTSQRTYTGAAAYRAGHGPPRPALGRNGGRPKAGSRARQAAQVLLFLPFVFLVDGGGGRRAGGDP